MMGIRVSAATAVIPFMLTCAAACLAGEEPAGHVVAGNSRPRARDIGIEVGTLPPGDLNAITDVPGLRVGHRTRFEGEEIRTGVTVIIPHGGNIFREKVPGAVFIGNGFGKPPLMSPR